MPQVPVQNIKIECFRGGSKFNKKINISDIFCQNKTPTNVFQSKFDQSVTNTFGTAQSFLYLQVCYDAANKHLT